MSDSNAILSKCLLNKFGVWRRLSSAAAAALAKSGSLNSKYGIPDPETWNYIDTDTERGPRNWLKAFNCPGHCQSPISIDSSTIKSFSALNTPFTLIGYDKALRGEAINTGHGVHFFLEKEARRKHSNHAEYPSIVIAGAMLDQPYRFVQYHFHWAQHDDEGSEHIIDGQRYPAELHIVHRGAEDPTKFAVLAVFLQVKDDNENLDSSAFNIAEFDAFSAVSEQYCRHSAISSGKELRGKLPAGRTSRNVHAPVKNAEFGIQQYMAPYIRYNGSLTTPPCTENVLWTIFLDPIWISRRQLDILRSVKDHSGNIIERNCRPIQVLNLKHSPLFASLTNKQ